MTKPKMVYIRDSAEETAIQNAGLDGPLFYIDANGMLCDADQLRAWRLQNTSGVTNVHD